MTKLTANIRISGNVP